ncbi:hypothetical protein HPB50_019123 [Hyalomma asiaticum]|uniref:Uncharacterized protein n=1 Tax=Hyalomma asiaticum TaxID=266040 RepID=A0ACB7T5V6_HYAAI|nr:hypothetical protein HPB50_019123 [Hyalomma asiaticum]
MKPQRIKGSVTKAGRMPRLPKEHEKVIIRPQRGLNIAGTTTPLLASAILAASGIKREDAKEDILSPNAQQNIEVVSSPSTEHTERYKQIKQLVINSKRYETNTYVSATEKTSKGVIRGIPLEYNKTIAMDIFNPRNPLALAARRLGNTTAIIITFDGTKVPRTVLYNLALMLCTLCKKLVDICHQCGRLGHRMDVCPNPTNRICRSYGARIPN